MYRFVLAFTGILMLVVVILALIPLLGERSSKDIRNEIQRVSPTSTPSSDDEGFIPKTFRHLLSNDGSVAGQPTISRILKTSL
jgi:hypothetical protein